MTSPLPNAAATPSPALAPASPARRKWLGVRQDALLEIALALAAVVGADMLWGSGDRFAQVWPHPFGLIVLVVASRYGTREGLAAVVVCSAVLLLGHSPQDGAALGLQGLPLQATMQPLAWGLAALVFGEIRDAWRRRTEAMREELDELRQQTRVITRACDRLQREKEHLESRVASQVHTVKSMYDAARAIEKQDVGDVLIGVGDLVRAVLAPEKFSLFLLNGSRLEATICEGWTHDDGFGREFDESSPLFHAVVFDRRSLVLSRAGDEPVLRGEGLLAGPVVDNETGGVVGMLKVEDIRFLDLHSTGVENFRILCEWIGSALAQARQLENMRTAGSRGSRGPDGVLGSAEAFAADCAMFRALAERSRFPGCVLHLGFEDAAASDAAGAVRRSRIVGQVVQEALGPQDRCYQTADPQWPYAAVLPGSTLKTAEAVAHRFATKLVSMIGADGPQPVVRRRLESLGPSA